MIDRKTIIDIMSERFGDYDGDFPENNFLIGLIIISEFLGTVAVTPLPDKRLLRTVDVDTLLAHNITTLEIERLRDMGWYIENDYFVVGV